MNPQLVAEIEAWTEQQIRCRRAYYHDSVPTPAQRRLDRDRAKSARRFYYNYSRRKANR